MVTIQDIRRRKDEVRRSLRGDRGSSARQKQDTLRQLEQAERILERKGSQSAVNNILSNISKKAIFGGRQQIQRSTQNAQPNKPTIVRDSSGRVIQASSSVKARLPNIIGKRISTRQSQLITGGIAGTISKKQAQVAIQQQRRIAKRESTKTRDFIDKNRELSQFIDKVNKRIQQENKNREIAQQKQKQFLQELNTNNIKSTFSEKIADKSILRLNKSNDALLRELEQIERKNIARKELKNRVKKTIIEQLFPGKYTKKIEKIINKKLQSKFLPKDIDLKLIYQGEKAFVGTKALGSQLAKIVDTSIAIDLIIASNAIEAIKKGRGKEFIRSTIRQLKSQNKDSVKFAKQGIKEALKDPSTYLNIPEASMLKGAVGLAAVKKGFKSGGKTVTKTRKTPNGKTVVISREKVIRFGDGKLKVKVDQSGAKINIVPKGPKKTLRGKLGRKPTLSQAIPKRGKINKDQPFIVSTKGTINSIKRESRKFLKQSISQPKTLILKQKVQDVKDFQKLSNKVFKNTIKDNELRKYTRLQQKPHIIKILKKSVPDKEKVPFGVRGTRTQGRESIRQKLIRSAKVKSRQKRREKLKKSTFKDISRDSIGDKKLQKRKQERQKYKNTKFTLNQKINSNVLTSSDAKDLPIISNARTKSVNQKKIIVETDQQKIKRIKDLRKIKNIENFREKQKSIQAIEINLLKKEAIKLAISYALLFSNTQNVNASRVQLLNTNNKLATIRDIVNENIIKLKVKINLKNVSTKTKSNVLKRIPSTYLKINIRTTRITKPKSPTIPKVPRTSKKSKIPKIPKTPKKPKLPQLPKPKVSKTKRQKINSYDVYILKNRKYIRVNNGSLTKSAAQSLLDNVLDKSVGASGYIKGSKARPNILARKLPYISQRKFRKPKAKSKLKRVSKVEKSKNRIDTRGEKRGLSAAKVAKRLLKNANKKRRTKKSRAKKRK